MNDKKLLKAPIAKFGHNRVMSHALVSERFFKEDNSNEFSSEEQQLEKAIYDSIVTDGFKAVSVTKDHVYIVVE